ncbi:hypothetical protein [Neobacillus terrae]|jgi:hypothetical protein|nr:hypothetical protein [Neobacillus terrae]NHM31530.1 hypothetical protein [Neobacillus terrae]
MGRVKLGNRNAQINNSKKKGRTSSELVEFSTGDDQKRPRPNGNSR